MSLKPGFFLALAGGLGACVIDVGPGPVPASNDIGAYELPSIIHEGRALDFESMIQAAVDARAVLIGETHDRLDHHLSQLEIIKHLHERRPGLAIGMEQFQQPFQRWLDEYIEGSIDTEAMLIGTEYYRRWKFDYRLYEPILSYARAHHIPVIALNLPEALTRKVAAGGLEALSPGQAAQVPEIDRSDQDYRKRLQEVFERHPAGEHRAWFENFYTAQLLWDEGMAARAAEYLHDHPGDLMVILAGRGHIEYGSGIPNRLARRIGGRVVTVVEDGHGGKGSGRADYILDSKPVGLPERGLIGVVIDADARSARVSRLMDKGAAKAAGVKIGDVITRIDDEPVADLAEVKTRLWNKLPGDPVRLTVSRSSDRTLTLDLTLR